MKKVLILANYGMGLYKFRKELLSELVKHYEVYISVPNSEFSNEFANMGCQVLATEIDRRGTNITSDLKLLNQYNKIFKEVKPDVVLTYTIKPNIYGGIVAKKYKIPVICNITGLGTALSADNIFSKVLKKLYKIGISKADTVFFQNRFNLKFFEKNKLLSNNSQVFLLPGSGVNTNEFELLDYPKSNKQTHLVFISRIMKDKGIEELLDAVEYFKETNKNIHFHICGFDEEGYEVQLKKLNDEGILTYHGMINDIRPILKEAHALVHPSYHEGMSNVMLEAGASGRPLIASNIPGCKEIVNDGETGFLFESKILKDLIDKIERFLALSITEKENMGLKSREKIVNEFNREIVIDKYIKSIEQIGVNRYVV